MSDSRPPARRWRLPAALLLILLLVLALPVRNAWRLSRDLDLPPEPLPTDLRVFAHDQASPGARALLACEVLDRKSSRPLPGARLEVFLRGPSSVDTAVAEAEAGADGTHLFFLNPPPMHQGECEWVVRARGPGDRRPEVRLPMDAQGARRISLFSDKPVYQPGQVVHLRARLEHVGLRRPVEDTPVVFEAEDARRNVVFRKEERTSRFGLVTVDCPLAEELNAGEWRLRARVAGETGGPAGSGVDELVVQVRRYVVPKFKVTLTTDRTAYAARDRIHGTVEAAYTVGGPVASGKVGLAMSLGDKSVSSRLEGRTDAAGKWEFVGEVPAPNLFGARPGDQERLRLEATVTDAAGHAETRSIERLLESNVLKVSVHPIAPAVLRGLRNDCFVATRREGGRPASAKVMVPDGTLVSPIVTGEDGFGRFSWSSQRAGSEATEPVVVWGEVEATTHGVTGAKGGQIVDMLGPRAEYGYPSVPDPLRRAVGADSPARFLLRTDRTIFRVGETLRLAFDAVNAGGRYLVVVSRAGHSLLTRTAEAPSTTTSVEIPVTKELGGFIAVHAVRSMPDGAWALDRRVLFVDDRAEMRIQATLDRETYRPGETAEVRIRVQNDSGNPEPAALSLSVADEAVLSLGTPDALGRGVADQTAAGIGATTAGSGRRLGLPLPAPGEPADQAMQQAAAATLASADLAVGATFASSYEIERDTLEAAVKKKSARLVEFDEEGTRWLWSLFVLAAFWLVPGAIYFDEYGTARGIAWWLAIPAWLGSGVLLDRVTGFEGVCVCSVGLLPFGSLYAYLVHFATGRERAAAAVMWTLTLVLGFGIFSSIMIPRLYDFGGHRPPAPDPPTTSLSDLDDSARKSSVRVREHFPETLFWRPEVLTDEHGEAAVSIPLADNITTWRLDVQGVTAAGQGACTTAGIPVFQDFFVDLDLPLHLTVGDEVQVPVAIHNHLTEDQEVRVALESGDWFTALDGLERRVVLGPGEISSVRFGVRARTFGLGRFTVHAFGSRGVADAVRRSVNVLPDGEEETTAVSDELGAGAVSKLRFPDEAIPGTCALFLKLYPTAFTELVDGLDRMVRLPYG
ncbi:MAG: hypothetical protein HYZ53_30015 [Planctomycetes bacterium]|nr:hypothetical protein [Planctomycetota bacterium]